MASNEKQNNSPLQSEERESDVHVFAKDQELASLRNELRDAKLYQYELEAQLREMMHEQRSQEHTTHYLKNIINTLPVGFMVLENQERIKQINQVAANYFSVDLNHAIGMSIFSVLKTSDLVRSMIKWLTIGTRPITVSLGSVAKKLITLEKAQISNQETLVICFDRTADHKKISTINTSLNSVQQKNQQLEHFIQRFLHDFKASTDAASNLFSTIGNCQADDTIKSLAKRGQAHTQHISSAADAVLEYSRLINQDIKLKSAPTDIYRLFEKLIQRYDELAQQRNIHFTAECKLSSFNYVADRDKVEFVISQFIELAFRTTLENQQVNVTVNQNFSGNFDERAVYFTIEDTGCGFNSEQQAALFDPFSASVIPVLSPEDRFHLARAKGFIDLFNGDVTIESDVGKCTKFTIKFPLQLCDSVAPHHCTGQQKLPQLFAKVIYIIDDNPFNLDILEELLFPTSARIERFSSAQRALTAYEFFKPDLIIADIIMPDMDGNTFIRQLRNRGYTQPAIACTVESHPERILSLHDKGFDRVLNKPLNVEQLYSLIEELVEQI